MTMRTKHLMTAIMLPALFAACTNDDFQAIEQGNQGLDGREMVDNVTLTVNAAADTRLTWNNGYTFNDGDEIGACLMDVVDMTSYHKPNTVWHEWFTLTNYIHTNYKFTRENGEWTTGAKMSEGNYFFVMPYNANYGYRNAYTFDASTQTLEGTDRASLQKAYANNNHFVGYGKVVAGDAESESVAVDMVPVFGATGITIGVTGTKSYTIERIVLHGTKVKSFVTLNPTTCTAATQYNGITPTNDQHFNVAQYVADPAENMLLGNDGYYNPNWAGYNSINALKDLLDIDGASTEKVEVVLSKDNVVSEGKRIQVIAMAYPQSINSAGQLLLDIYTDKGIVRDIDLSEKHSSNDQGGAAGSTTTTNVITNQALVGVGTGNAVEVTFDDTALDAPETMDVENNSDLADLIHWNALNNTTAITANLKADVTITKAMYDELKGSKITSATINGSNNAYSVTVAADVADGALDAFTFTNVKNVTVKGTQSIAKAPVSPVTVAAGATLNIVGNLTQTNAMTKAITNKGTLNVNADVNANIASNGFAFINHATMTVAAGKTLDATAKVDNGIADKVAGVITNTGTITVLQNQEGTVTNTGVVGEEKSVNDIKRGTNAATIINNSGKVFLSQNTGDIYANGASTTRLASNKDGNLIITKLDKSNGNFLTGTGDAKGNLVQEITADANTDAVDVRANTLWLGASLKVEKQNENGEYVTVTFTEAGKLVKNGSIKVVAVNKKARVVGHDQWFQIGAIEVNKDATLTLENVKATIIGDTSVSMFGEANHKATLTINTNASLMVEGNASQEITIQGDATNNVLDNNSSSTNIGF